MQSILEQITDWLKSMIISGIMGNLSGMFDSVNQQVGQIAGDVGTTPANFSPAVFSMIRNISESVILPIAGMVLTFIACYELIQMVTMLALSAIIFVIVYGRMVEIYLMVSLAPIPFATFGNHEQSHTGQNYLRSLFALGFQGFLIMICVGIYAVLIQNLSFSDNIISSIWGVLGYTVLLAFTLFKTGSLAKSVFAAH